MSTQTKIDHLTEDEPISGQKYVLVSIITPELIKNCTVRGIKVRGVYGTEQEARVKAAELQKQDLAKSKEESDNYKIPGQNF